MRDPCKKKKKNVYVQKTFNLKRENMIWSSYYLFIALQQRLRSNCEGYIQCLGFLFIHTPDVFPYFLSTLTNLIKDIFLSKASIYQG